MPVHTLSIDAAQGEIRELIRRDAEAVVRGIHRTLRVDAHRWIQWSIRGGGLGGEYPAPPGGYRKPIDTGRYANGWKTRTGKKGGSLYNTDNPMKVGVIEFGRRPGKGIPIEPLAEWVRRKLGVADEDEARFIALKISSRHRKRGRPGLHVLGRAHDKIADATLRNVRRELGEEA